MWTSRRLFDTSRYIVAIHLKNLPNPRSKLLPNVLTPPMISRRATYIMLFVMYFVWRIASLVKLTISTAFLNKGRRRRRLCGISCARQNPSLRMNTGRSRIWIYTEDDAVLYHTPHTRCSSESWYIDIIAPTMCNHSSEGIQSNDFIAVGKCIYVYMHVLHDVHVATHSIL